jgi:tetratricopeptide (TPR) repeat protein
MNQFSLRVGIDVTDDCAGSVNGIKHQLMSAEEVRAEGNRLFAARDFAGALASYDCALTLIAADDADTIATLHSNAAECHLKMDQFSEARSRSQAALDARPMHVKALFRHARACERLGEMAAAAVDVKKILHVEPTHKDATEMLQRIQKSERFSNDWSSIESTAIAVCKSNDTVASWESLQQAVQCFQQQTAEQKTFILSESAIPQLVVQFLQSIVKSESEHLLEALQAVHTLFSAHGRDKPGVAKGVPETLINQVCGCIGPAFQHSNSAVVVAAAALLEQIGTDSRVSNISCFF